MPFVIPGLEVRWVCLYQRYKISNEICGRHFREAKALKDIPVIGAVLTRDIPWTVCPAQGKGVILTVKELFWRPQKSAGKLEVARRRPKHGVLGKLLEDFRVQVLEEVVEQRTRLEKLGPDMAKFSGVENSGCCEKCIW